jgi:hypothetical protein
VEPSQYKGVLELCERIAEIDREQMRLRAEVERRTGKSYEDFIGGMRQLFEGGMTITVGGGDPMTPDEFIDRQRVLHTGQPTPDGCDDPDCPLGG